jgi:2-polyprenyl-3-methyl-5-hydroxy-6-metoxy-1,4-benzoquinol methylase
MSLAINNKMKKNRKCPFCKIYNNKKTIFLKENINNSKINKFSFSSRKIPEFMNFELLKCKNCSLIYANKIPNFMKIKKLYNETIYPSRQQALDASTTYFKYLKKNLKIKKKNNALDIGTGNGIFLTFLKKLGFHRSVGIEPSREAIFKASNKVGKKIVHGMFEEIEIKKNFFDLICCFMTMEHVYDPKKILFKSYISLKKGGFISLVTHDAENILHKILGKNSPIIDIEHLQLFSKKSIKSALINSGFENIKIITIKNSYNLSYWISLLPISIKIKKIAKVLLKKYLRIFNIKLALNVGNIMTIAEKK